MKRYVISFLLILATWQTSFAMSYERAREEALYLTDKMAYELNLNDQQYNDAYEINLDYFLSLNSEADLYEDYLSYRLSDFRHILYDWQYSIMLAADYFIRPVYWRAGGWYFPIYSHYSIGHFYYSYPSVYYSYHGGHGRIHYHSGFYASRRPVWNGGFRGNQPIGGRPNRNGNGYIGRGRNGRINGNGYHIDLRGNDRNSNRPDRGTSFGNSSSRNSRNDYSGRGGYGRDNSTTNRQGYNGTENRSFRNYDTNRTGEGTRNYSSNRGFEGARGSSMNRGNYSNPSSSGSNSGFSPSRSSGMSNRNYSSSPSSGSRSSSFGGSHSSGSRGGSFGGYHSSGSRGGGSFGGSRGSAGGGSVSRGRR